MTFLKRIWKTFRFGLLFNEIRYLLIQIGIEISPFYWTQEGISNQIPPIPKNGCKGYFFDFFGSAEMKQIAMLAKNHPEELLLSRLKEKKLCYGLKYNNHIASFNWFDLYECNYKGNNHLLDNNSVYLFDGYTMKQFRGLNLAPYLRYKSYDVLKKMGKKSFFSVTQLTNTPAINFKKKIGAKFLWLGVYVSIFNKIRHTFIIKRFKS